jgi:integrase
MKGVQMPDGLHFEGRAAWRAAVETLESIGERPERSGTALRLYAEATDTLAYLRRTWVAEGRPIVTMTKSGRELAHPMPSAIARVPAPSTSRRPPRANSVRGGWNREAETATPTIGPMTANALRLWGAKRLRSAVVAVVSSFDDASTYTLRHSHASALHYANHTPAEAAARMGHGLALHWKTYAHVIESITGKRYADLDALIEAARNDRVFRQSSAGAE